MKLNENKERIPATFITTYISDAWDKIGYINADIEAVKKAYSDTKGVVDCLQDIVDAYLVAAGRLQAILDKKDYVDFDVLDEKPEERAKEEDLKESFEPEIESESQVEPKIDEVSEEVIEEVADKEPDPEFATVIKQPVKENLNITANSTLAEAFEYQCDFDEPELTEADRAMFEAITQANNH